MKFHKFLFLFLFFLSPPLFAGVEQISEEEFRALATQLASKVNLFKEVWAKDPEAIFYGGTTRDYLYWLKRQFWKVNTRTEADEVIQNLKKKREISVRDFIIGDSDVDVISEKTIKINASEFGVRKIDSINPQIFDPQTPMGENEIHQGHAPIEKIRLTKGGLTQDPLLGDGLHEVYTGRPTVHFTDPEVFAKTKYAREGANHPILLALRYLRLMAINYYNSHGDTYSEKDLLLADLDPASQKAVQKIIAAVLKKKELEPFLLNHRFHSWINSTIQKSFRSYSNPTAALEYMKLFKVDELVRVYGETAIQPIYQYVFRKQKDPEKIAANLKKLNIDPERFFKKVRDVFPDGYFYHGTQDNDAFLSILLQGVLPSTRGAVGKGLYGVASDNKDYAASWGGTKNRVVRFPVSPDAKIVDIYNDPYVEGVLSGVVKNLEELADAFGIDMYLYPYGTKAFVVKNSAALGSAESEQYSKLKIYAMDRRAACRRIFASRFWKASPYLAGGAVAAELAREYLNSERQKNELFVMAEKVSRAKSIEEYFTALTPDQVDLDDNPFLEEVGKIYEKSVTQFLALHPTLDDLFKFKKNSGNGNANFSLTSRSISAAKNVDEFFTILAPYREQLNWSNKNLIRNFEAKYVPQFLALHPSLEQLDRAKRLCGSDDATIALVEQALPNAKNMEEYFKILAVNSEDLGFGGYHLEKDLAGIYLKTFSQFLSLSPTKDDFDQLKKNLFHLKGYKEITDIMKQQLPLVKNPEGFFEILSPGMQMPDRKDYDNYNRWSSLMEALAQVYNESIPQFLDFNPTVAEVAKFKRYSPYAQAVIDLMYQLLPKTKTVEDYFQVLNPELAKISDGYQRDLDKVYTASVPHFLELNPTIDDMKTFKKNIYSYEPLAELTKQVLPSIKSPGDLLDLIAPVEEGEKSLGSTYRLFNLQTKAVPRFLELKPTLADINRFKNTTYNPYGDNQAIMELLRESLPKAKTPEEFAELLRAPVLKPSKSISESYMKSLFQVYKEVVPLFLKEKPSLEEVQQILANP